jgi:ABC-2 type transport system permease protein
MNHPTSATGGTAPSPQPSTATWAPLYRLFLSWLSGRGRLLGLGALGLVAVVVGLAVGGQPRADRLEIWVTFANAFGLSLLAPVVALLVASASLGNPSEDGTLVYLWLRPVERWQPASAAYLASLTVALPVVAVPLALGAVAARAGAEAIWGTIASAVVAVVAYCGLFTWLGLRVRRALPWGLAYILIWEGFVAAAGAGASRLALRAYTRSILSDITGQDLRLADMTMPFAVLVPCVVGLGMVWLTGRRLGRTDVT